jgi:hypothetical protein
LEVREVTTVDLRGLTVARSVQEQLAGTLVDRQLRLRSAGNVDDSGWLASRRDCPGCRLTVACQDCPTVRITGSAYRRGRVTIAVEALGRPEQTALNPSRRRVVVTDENGLSELQAWIDGTGRSAVISVAADLLAAASAGPTQDDEPMTFQVVIQAEAEQAVRGTWTITSAVR